MKKVIALIGSQQKNGTYGGVLQLENYLKSYGEMEFDNIFLHEYNLEYCRGCKLCFNKGEEYCPLKDDRDILIDKIQQADGIIFASPNYSFHVSARMKNLFDRLAFIIHRPRFFGKTCTAIVAQGITGGGKIVKYLNGMGENFGFHATKGCVLATLEPSTEAMRKKNDKKIKMAAEGFYKELMRPTPSPSLFRLMLFRLTRIRIRSMTNAEFRDFRYYEEKGWFTSDYYYEAPLGPLKKVMGRLFDFLGRRIST